MKRHKIFVTLLAIILISMTYGYGQIFSHNEQYLSISPPTTLLTPTIHDLVSMEVIETAGVGDLKASILTNLEDASGMEQNEWIMVTRVDETGRPIYLNSNGTHANNNKATFIQGGTHTSNRGHAIAVDLSTDCFGNPNPGINGTDVYYIAGQGYQTRVVIKYEEQHAIFYAGTSSTPASNMCHIYP